VTVPLFVYFTESPREKTVMADDAQSAAVAAGRQEAMKHPDAEGSFTLPIWVCPADVEVVPARDVQRFDTTVTTHSVADVTAVPVADVTGAT
jgi:hypothetical protein